MIRFKNLSDRSQKNCAKNKGGRKTANLRKHIQCRKEPSGSVFFHTAVPAGRGKPHTTGFVKANCKLKANKENHLFVGTINPQMIIRAINALKKEISETCERS